MKTILSFLPALLLSLSVSAGTGTLKGKVTDSQTGEPLVSSSILVLGTTLGAATDLSGNYVISSLKAGIYTIKAVYVGYDSQTVTGVKIEPGKETLLNFTLAPSTIQAEEIVVSADRPKISRDNTNSVKTVSGASLMFQAGKAREIGYVVEGVPVPGNTEKYAPIHENRMLSARDNNFSTFSADVDRAAWATIRRFLNDNMLPDPGALRIEEMVNYFPYDYPAPVADEPFSVTQTYTDCPWNPQVRLVSIGIQSRKIEKVRPNNLVFLIDVSGSMDSPDKLPLVRQSLAMLLDHLAPQDRIAIVVYAGAAGMVLPSTPVSEKEVIEKAIAGLEAGGSTAGGEGIRLAYSIAGKNFIREGNNRIILATDGDFNVGISSTSELTRFIESQRKTGIYLTALGFGSGNYRDELLQELADRGNGNHGYIDGLTEAKKILVDELQGTLVTVAKDVKIQVEFNPAKVDSFRLIGYENRMLNKEDFKDDKRDAGEVGSGHQVTALYEIFPAARNSQDSQEGSYTRMELTEKALKSDDLLTVRIRYKNPEDTVSRELGSVLKDKITPLAETEASIRFATAVAEFGLVLRESPYRANATCSSAIQRAEAARGKDQEGYRSEFISLVKKADLMLRSRIQGRND